MIIKSSWATDYTCTGTLTWCLENLSAGLWRSRSLRGPAPQLLKSINTKAKTIKISTSALFVPEKCAQKERRKLKINVKCQKLAELVKQNYAAYNIFCITAQKYLRFSNLAQTIVWGAGPQNLEVTFFEVFLILKIFSFIAYYRGRWWFLALIPMALLWGLQIVTLS